MPLISEKNVLPGCQNHVGFLKGPIALVFLEFVLYKCTRFKPEKLKKVCNEIYQKACFVHMPKRKLIVSFEM